MKFRLLAIALFLSALIITTCAIFPAPSDQKILEPQSIEEPWMIETDAGLIHEEIDDQDAGATDAGTIIVTREQMVSDIIALWTLFFHDEGASVDDDRRIMFPLYAEQLADAILMYQQENIDTQEQLPVHISTHILFATMVTLESSITYDVIGKSNGEVGLLQVHGKALAGYKASRVQKNSELGLILGVRWLTELMAECRETKMLLADNQWATDDWTKPLSVYAGGPKAMISRNRCLRFGVAKKRVALTKLYLTRIRQEED